MHNIKDETPPSSINGDEITGMDEEEEEEEMIYVGDLDDIQLDEEEMEDQEEDMEIERPEDLAALVFNKHSASVFCCDIHPSGKLAVTGGEDDIAYIWSVETGQVVMECTGHKDSVIFVGFSFDGAYVATVDMGGLIKVWKCNTEENQQTPWPVTFEYETDDFTWAQWHFGARVLLCGSVTGDVYVFKIPSGDTKVLQGNNVKFECGKLFKDGIRLAAGYEDGTIKIWDLKTSNVLHQIPSNIHEESKITDIDTHPDNNLMASISSDGKVILTTAHNGKVVGQLDAGEDLETIAFSQDLQLPYFAIGTLKGSSSIWDIARQMVRSHCSKSNEEEAAGITKLKWVKDQVVAGCLDGSVRIYDGRSGERKQVLTGHWSEVLDLSYNSKENIILTTSDDGTARIFKMDPNKDKN